MTDSAIFSQYIWRFGPNGADGDETMVLRLGGKGAFLAGMCKLGLPVPAGFTMPPSLAKLGGVSAGQPDDEARALIAAGVASIEQACGRQFGAAENPLLLSVRSGAAQSMPGMMDSILNLGLNDKTVAGLAAKSGQARFAWDNYRRFIQMFANVVWGIGHDGFEDIFETHKDRYAIENDYEIDAIGLQTIVAAYHELIVDRGFLFPQDPWQQLYMAISAVFNSWHNDRARFYRKMHQLSDEGGTAATIQAMVFGNLDENSASGVAFSRNPSNGQKGLFGEFLPRAQGEDIVAGIRTPHALSEAQRLSLGERKASLEALMPDAFGQLADMLSRLETHFADVQDVEFTIENGQVWLLQTRAAKRSATAAVELAVNMAQEGLISTDQAILRIVPNSLQQLLHPKIAEHALRDVFARGLPASPGAAAGFAVFSAGDAEIWTREGRPVILFREETSPEDIRGIYAARATVTARGGITCHAAVVARGISKPCVVGATRMEVGKDFARAGGREIRQGDMVSVDGANGDIMMGAVDMAQPQLSPAFATLMGWADMASDLDIRANAETSQEVGFALGNGAKGLGLVRTEHMFFQPESLALIQNIILAKNAAESGPHIADLEALQAEDFYDLMVAVDGLPINVRLLDPPLSDFLPHSVVDIDKLAKARGQDVSTLSHQIQLLAEANPSFGQRGCRLALGHAPLYKMQMRALFRAADKAANAGVLPKLIEIMVPLVMAQSELDLVAKLLYDAKTEAVAAGLKVPEILLGTMIELPRACIMADKLAQKAAFFSIGSNDLTQATLGLGRDDGSRFLGRYISEGLLANDPFLTLDQDGVGALIKMAVQKGRAENPNLVISLCGEHASDPQSIAFCHSLGLNYLSCAPHRVPIARLAAAQAAIIDRQKT